ncbi:hypothetical protein Naga_100102g12 [Nannochloropsis gaditana]|uniref:Uncharacterized protein n=1 Tax=Nannochloropsis gaditana TaxID=72520 RepID=W7THI8_9STRA|nr:hypothetical protein Naga_100102g12 [Nannochloropsis gaditana]
MHRKGRGLLVKIRLDRLFTKYGTNLKRTKIRKLCIRRGKCLYKEKSLSLSQFATIRDFLRGDRESL